MPNIEIHGLHRTEARALFQDIFKLFKDRPYVDEMVVTMCDTIVENKHCKPQPFIRLANSCQEHTDEILERLQTLNIDIEHLVLAKFIPKNPNPDGGG